MTEPDAIELRVLGCLIEKQRTTPDAYPLSLNALRLACNQSTNRDPVMDLDEAAIRDALNRLYHRRWTRLTSAQGSRAAKYRHLLDGALGVGAGELALLGVLLLRGPQTPGELHQRATRLHPFAGLDAVHDTLGRLVARGLVERQARRPGQKEERYAQLLGAREEAPPGGDRPPIPTGGEATAPPSGFEAATGTVQPEPAAAAPESEPTADTRLERLEREVARLRAEVAELRDALGG